MFCGPAWIRRRAAATSVTRSCSYLTSSGPKHRSQTYRASSGYSFLHSLHRKALAAICVLAFRGETLEAAATSTGIGTVLGLGESDGLPGLRRACPSTPLDVFAGQDTTAGG